MFTQVFPRLVTVNRLNRDFLRRAWHLSTKISRACQRFSQVFPRLALVNRDLISVLATVYQGANKTQHRWKFVVQQMLNHVEPSVIRIKKAKPSKHDGYLRLCFFKCWFLFIQMTQVHSKMFWGIFFHGIIRQIKIAFFLFGLRDDRTTLKQNTLFYILCCDITWFLANQGARCFQSLL